PALLTEHRGHTHTQRRQEITTMSELTRQYLRRRNDDAKQAFDDAKAAVYYRAAVLDDDDRIGRLRDLIEQANAAGRRWRETCDAYLAVLEAEQAKSMVEAVQ